MKPILWDSGLRLPELGPLNVPSYFTLLALSFAIGAWMTWREAPRLGLDRERVLDLDVFLVVWALIGARLMHVLVEGHLMEYVNLCLAPDKVRPGAARDCLATLKLWRGGMAFYGGFLFASAFGLWFARRHRLGMGRMADLAAPWIAFGLALTRMGCFLAGCCYGRPWSGPFAVQFPWESVVRRFQIAEGVIGPDAPALHVHPAQIYLALGNLALFVGLYFFVRPRKRFGGEVFAWLLIGKGILRFVVEFVRADERGLWAGISSSQIVAAPLVIAGAVWLWHGRSQAMRNATSPAAG